MIRFVVICVFVFLLTPIFIEAHYPKQIEIVDSSDFSEKLEQIFNNRKSLKVAEAFPGNSFSFICFIGSYRYISEQSRTILNKKGMTHKVTDKNMFTDEYIEDVSSAIVFIGEKMKAFIDRGSKFFSVNKEDCLRISSSNLSFLTTPHSNDIILLED